MVGPIARASAVTFLTNWSSLSSSAACTPFNIVGRNSLKPRCVPNAPYGEQSYRHQNTGLYNSKCLRVKIPPYATSSSCRSMDVHILTSVYIPLTRNIIALSLIIVLCILLWCGVLHTATSTTPYLLHTSLRLAQWHSMASLKAGTSATPITSLKWGITHYGTTLFSTISKWTTATNLEIDLKWLNSLKILITWRRVDRRPTASPITTPNVKFVDLQCATVTLK